MKIKFGSLLLLPFALLTSCSLFSANDHRTQIIFEGEFVGDYFSSKSNTPGEPTKSNCANLKITNISKEDFDNANGLDVVQDFKSGDEPYFKLELKILNDKNASEEPLTRLNILHFF